MSYSEQSGINTETKLDYSGLRTGQGASSRLGAFALVVVRHDRLCCPCFDITAICNYNKSNLQPRDAAAAGEQARVQNTWLLPGAPLIMAERTAHATQSRHFAASWRQTCPRDAAAVGEQARVQKTMLVPRCTTDNRVTQSQSQYTVTAICR